MLVSEIAERVHRYDWDAIGGALDADGWARLPRLLRSRECTALRALYTDDARFRSTVDMARHGFGRGEYRYFAHPLPPLVTALRESLYPPLAATARDWARRLHRDPEQFPPTLREFLARCDDAGQRRPTPLLLRYSAGDWNALHQDLYGAVAFPLQVLVVLSPQDEYEGQRPRQARTSRRSSATPSSAATEQRSMATQIGPGPTEQRSMTMQIAPVPTSRPLDARAPLV